MLGINKDLSYLFEKFEHGVLLGAGAMLFGSGVIIGFKTASFVVSVSNDIASNGMSALRKEIKNILDEEYMQ